jgi:tRNA A-37 threonylcarbamoyl transferase component Bud32
MTDATVALVPLTVGGTRWRVPPECREVLFGPAGLRLEEWLRDGRATVVKHGPHRTVYRVTLPGLDGYLKHYRLPDTRAWLRGLVRPCKARMEYDRAVGVAARGIATVTPLALGEPTGAGPADSFLMTRTLDGTEPLSAFIERTLPTLEPGRRARVALRLAVVLGKFLAGLHDAGVLHHDLHAGNVLLRLGPGDEPEPYLIDLHAVHLGRPLDRQARAGNLVIFNRWFVLRVNRSARLRFWKAYLGGRWVAADREEARDLERATWSSNLDFWRGLDRRCLLRNRHFEPVRAAGVAGHAVRELDRAALAALLADPDGPFRRPGVRLLKDSRSSTVAELEVPVNGVVLPVIYKRFRVTTWSDPWLGLVRRTPALRSWVQGHGLLNRCLPTPRPLAAFHRRAHGCPAEGYLLTEKVEGARDLYDFVAGLPRAELRAAVERLAALVRELHRRRLAHRDLKAANVLVTPGPAFWFIDLVGVTRHNRLSRRRRVRDLARLHASFLRGSLTRTDKLRFLRVYLQLGLLGRERWKGWWRAVGEATQAKVARNLRSGRPLA